MRDIIVKALLHLKRKDNLLKNIPKCPNCYGLYHDSVPVNQVQLVDYVNTIPAKWQCRKCKHKFEFEPDDNN